VRVPDQYNLNANYTLNSGNSGDVFAPRTPAYTQFWRGFFSS
jgi:hypothetical protein